jgi:murein DD-endopeptidase MepM/ murein hydrolase activator NlpD
VAKNRLVDAQEELAAAESRLKRAKARLAITRRELEDVKADLERTKKRLAKHQGAVQERLLAVYRSAEPSYVEVLLNATSFEDFANRAEFTKTVALRDETVLVQIVRDKRRMEEQQRLLERKEREQAELKAKVARERAAVAEKRAEAAKLARKARSDVREVEAQLAAQEAEIRSVSAMLKRLASSRGGGGGYRYYGNWSGSLGRPVPGYVSSPFGMRIHPITHTRRFHDGVDLACGGGTSISCAAAGTVVSAGWHGAYGLAVIVDHGGGISTMYGHCERGSIQVNSGQTVSRGQALARVDSTGWSTGDHLHWTVFRNGDPVDPFSM